MIALTRRGSRLALIAAFLVTLCGPATAGLFWDAAVARNKQLIALCVEYAGGLNDDALRAKLREPGPLPDEFAVLASEDGAHQVQFFQTTFLMTRDEDGPTCTHQTEVLDNVGRVGEATIYMIAEAYRSFENAFKREGGQVETLDGIRRVTLPDGARVDVVRRLSPGSMNLPMGYLLRVTPVPSAAETEGKL